MVTFNFRLWLESHEEYEKKFSSRAKSAFYQSEDHFSKWFPEHLRRIYIPLNQSLTRSFTQFQNSKDYYSPEDQEVIEGLKDLGFEVLDYREGYVRRGQGKEKIGGVLSRLIATAENSEKKSLYNRWLRRFSTSPARNAKNLTNDMWIIISRNPHDIARMSYDTSWESCMELTDGMYKHVPFCVIKSGGMVAYLLNKSEQEVKKLVISEWEPIEKPLARVSIKAAKKVNDPSVVIAILEENVYGVNVKGFWETVKNWLDKHQSDIGSGRYKVLGGYSDTWGGSEKYRAYQHVPRDESSLLKWLKSNLSSRRESAIQYILDNHNDIKYQKVWEAIKSELIDEATHDSHYGLTHVEERLLFLIGIKPDLFTDEDLHKMPYNIKYRLNKLNKQDMLISNIVNQNISEIKTPQNAYLTIAKELSVDHRDKLLKLLNEIGDGKTSIESGSIIRLCQFLTRYLNTISNINRMSEFAKIVNEKDPSFLENLYKQFILIGGTFIKNLSKKEFLSNLNYVSSDRVVEFLTNIPFLNKDINDLSPIEDDLVSAILNVVISYSAWTPRKYWISLIEKVIQKGSFSVNNKLKLEWLLKEMSKKIEDFYNR